MKHLTEFLFAVALIFLAASDVQAKNPLWTGNCENLLAPPSMPAETEATKVGYLSITHDSAVMVRAHTFSGTIVGKLILKEGVFSRKILVFSVYDGDRFLVFRVGQPLLVELDDGRRLNVFAGGKLLGSDVEIQAETKTKYKCVAISSQAELVTPQYAKEAGYDVLTGVTPDEAGSVPPAPHDLPPMDGEDLGSVFDKDKSEAPEPDDAGGLSAAMGVPADPEPSNGLSKLFEPDATLPKDGPRIATSEDLRERIDEVVVSVNSERDEDRPPGVCHIATGTVLGLSAPVPSYALVGRLNPAANLDTYRLIPFTDDVVGEPFKASLGNSEPDQFVRVAQPFGLQPHPVAGGDPVPIVNLLDMSVVKFGAVETPVAASGGLIRLVVASDAAMLSVSGLDHLETTLRAWSGKIMWRVDWVEITDDGNVLEPVTYPSLTSLVESVKGRSSSFSPVLADQFDALLGQFEQVLSADGMPISRFIWLIEGHPLPHSTPLRLEALLKRINSVGNVVRRSNGKARQWLEIVAGQYSTQFAQFYLEGPIKTTPGGRLTVENRNGRSERDMILTDPKGIIDRLKISVSALGDVAPVTAPGNTSVNTDGLVFDRNQLLAEIGLLVARESYPDFRTSLALAITILALNEGEYRVSATGAAVDVVALSTLRTNDASELTIRPLVPSGLERWIGLIKSRASGEKELESLKSWLRAAQQGLLTYQDIPTCDYLFIPASTP